MNSSKPWIITRRTFLHSTITATVANTLQLRAEPVTRKPVLRFGIVTDSHYADTPDNGARCYRQSLAKMQECVDLMNQQKVDFLIELGDFKDQGKPPSEKSTLQFLKAIESVYSGFEGPRYHVLGNHDMDSISKTQFLNHVTNSGISKERSYYSFDMKGIHCIVFDANFLSDAADYDRGNFNWKDANIPPKEVTWLKQDLASTKLPVICFSHQELKGEGSAICNADEICKVLADSGSVLAVFQGHHHAGAYVSAENIHYYTLKCMVEGSKTEDNAYAIVSVFNDNSIAVEGYRRARSKNMKTPTGIMFQGPEKSEDDSLENFGNK